MTRVSHDAVTHKTCPVRDPAIGADGVPLLASGEGRCQKDGRHEAGNPGCFPYDPGSYQGGEE